MTLKKKKNYNNKSEMGKLHLPMCILFVLVIEDYLQVKNRNRYTGNAKSKTYIFIYLLFIHQDCFGVSCSVLERDLKCNAHFMDPSNLAARFQ